MKQEFYKLATKKPHTVSLIILYAFAAMGAILMAPALPEIAKYFAIPDATAKLTVTMFLMGYAAGQLIYGPLANRYGRKIAYYIGITLATLGSLFSILSSPTGSFHLLLVGRLLEALGMSSGLVISYTIISDYYYPHQSRTIIAYLMTASAIFPAVATVVGGFLVEYINWQSCFYFLLFYGFALLVPIMFLPETATQLNIHALKPKEVIKSYSISLRNTYLILTAIGCSIPVACTYLFVTEGPFIGIHYLGLSPSRYGLLGMIPFIGTLAGAFVSVKLSKSKLPLANIIIAAYLLQLIATLVMMILFLMRIINLYSLLVPTIFLMFAGCIILSNLAAISTVKLEDKASANAILQFIIVLTPVISTFVLGNIHISSPIVLPLLFFAMLFIMFVVGILFKCKKLKLQV